MDILGLFITIHPVVGRNFVALETERILANKKNIKAVSAPFF
jgi:hypothetical protein